MWEIWILLGILIVLSVADLRKKTLPAWLILVSAVGGFCHVSILNWGKMQWMVWMVSSASVLIFCKITRQALGYGDGMIWGVTWLYLGGEKNIKLWIIAFFLAFCFSIIALFLKKADQKTKLPFLPFLAASHGFLLAIGEYRVI